MKTYILTLFCAVAAWPLYGQGMTTNVITVISSSNQVQIMRTANAIDNYRRTNGFAPYTAPTNALNLRAFVEIIAADALEKRASVYISRDENDHMRALNEATDEQRINARKQLPPYMTTIKTSSTTSWQFGSLRVFHVLVGAIPIPS
jgi:hypothetical protein